MKVISLVLPILTSIVVVTSAAPVSEAPLTKRDDDDREEFFYKYVNANGVDTGKSLNVKVMDTRGCYNIKEAEAEGTKSAHSPANLSARIIRVYKEVNCKIHVDSLQGGDDYGRDVQFRSFGFA